MKFPVHNQKGEKIDSVNLPENIFGLIVNHNLINQTAIIARANQQKPWAHTKTRKERRGGGRKPWRQKGTGRARHGSRRSPLWHKGGVVFGPRKNKNLKKQINKKMKQTAIKQVLSSKVKDKELIIVDQIKAKKTKEFVQILKNLKLEQKSLLFAQADKQTNLALRNIPKTHYTRALDINILDLLNYKYLLLSKKALLQLIKRFN